MPLDQKTIQELEKEKSNMRKLLDSLKNKIPYLFIEEPYDTYSYELDFGNPYGGSSSGGDVDYSALSSVPGISTDVLPKDVGLNNPL